MTTFEHGKAPEWACATWRYPASHVIVDIPAIGKSISLYDPTTADHLCRALSLAKLAEDWAAASRDLDAIVDGLGDMFIESAEANAACVKSDAARALLLKACAE